MKNFSAVLIILALALSLGFAACGDDDVAHTNPSFLQGEWVKPKKLTFKNGSIVTEAERVTFTIDEDLNFLCDVRIPIDPNNLSGDTKPARLTGWLEYENSKFGPNDYMLKDLEAAASETGNEPWDEGNEILNQPMGEYHNRLAALKIYDLLFTLTPGPNKTKFTFSTQVAEAEIFFGGTFTKNFSTTFYVGTWANNTGITFTIANNFTFTCSLPSVPMFTGPAALTGKLNFADPTLSPDQCFLENLTVTTEPTPMTPATLQSMVDGFNGITCTLAPSANNTAFTFSSDQQMASVFFGGGGDFIKQP